MSKKNESAKSAKETMTFNGKVYEIKNESEQNAFFVTPNGDNFKPTFEEVFGEVVAIVRETAKGASTFAIYTDNNGEQKKVKKGEAFWAKLGLPECFSPYEGGAGTEKVKTPYQKELAQVQALIESFGDKVTLGELLGEIQTKQQEEVERQKAANEQKKAEAKKEREERKEAKKVESASDDVLLAEIAKRKGLTLDELKAQLGE